MSGATRTSIIPKGNSNRPGTKLRGLRNIVVHETANQSPGADAEMHRRFVHNGGGPANVSFHYVVDDHESIQLLPDDEVGYQAGDGGGPGNYESVGIETCVNSDGDFVRAVDNLVKLVKALMAEFGIPVARVRQHNFYSSYQKNCPRRLRANNEAEWKAFIARLGTTTPPTPVPAPTPPPVPRPAIEAYYLTHGDVGRFGLPLEEGERSMMLEDGQVWQVKWYERALLHWRPGQPVGEARVGWMLLAKLREDGLITA